MLLEALAACAGGTVKAVATALDIRLQGGTVRAEGDPDFRGALGVDGDAAVGFSNVRLRFAQRLPARCKGEYEHLTVRGRERAGVALPGVWYAPLKQA